MSFFFLLLVLVLSLVVGTTCDASTASRRYVKRHVPTIQRRMFSGLTGHSEDARTTPWQNGVDHGNGLRLKVLAYYLLGNECNEIATKPDVNLHRRTVYRWIDFLRERNTIFGNDRGRPQWSGRFTRAARMYIRFLLRAGKQRKTLEDLRDKLHHNLGVAASTSYLCDVLHAMGVSWKRLQKYDKRAFTAQNLEFTARFLFLRVGIPLQFVVFVDEMYYSAEAAGSNYSRVWSKMRDNLHPPDLHSPSS